jgi:hypothetical protein
VAKKTAKKGKKKKTGDIEIIDNDSSDFESSEAVKKTKQKTSKLLRAKLSDTDDESKKKTSSVKDDESEDSDVATRRLIIYPLITLFAAFSAINISKLNFGKHPNCILIAVGSK